MRWPARCKRIKKIMCNDPSLLRGGATDSALSCRGPIPGNSGERCAPLPPIGPETTDVTRWSVDEKLGPGRNPVELVREHF